MNGFANPNAKLAALDWGLGTDKFNNGYFFLHIKSLHTS